MNSLLGISWGVSAVVITAFGCLAIVTGFFLLQLPWIIFVLAVAFDYLLTSQVGRDPIDGDRFFVMVIEFNEELSAAGVVYNKGKGKKSV